MYDVFLNFCFPYFILLTTITIPILRLKLKLRIEMISNIKKCIVGAACLLLGKERSVRLRVMYVSFIDSQVKEVKKGGDKF